VSLPIFSVLRLFVLEVNGTLGAFALPIPGKTPDVIKIDSLLGHTSLFWNTLQRKMSSPGVVPKRNRALYSGNPAISPETRGFPSPLHNGFGLICRLSISAADLTCICACILITKKYIVNT
jgi:hypothetical protein